MGKVRHPFLRLLETARRDGPCAHLEARASGIKVSLYIWWTSGFLNIRYFQTKQYIYILYILYIDNYIFYRTKQRKKVRSRASCHRSHSLSRNCRVVLGLGLEPRMVLRSSCHWRHPLPTSIGTIAKNSGRSLRKSWVKDQGCQVPLLENYQLPSRVV